VQEGYDVTTGYNYHDVGGEQPNRPIPYRRLVQDNEAMWQRVATHLPQPYIPVVTTGWDQRFSSREQRRAFFYTGRTPQALTCYMAAARRWVDRHPTRTVPERIVLLFAWNEIGEGGALIPNRADGYAYTNAVRRVFGQPPVGPPLTGCH
jgi:Glycosyltransferase WbsX